MPENWSMRWAAGLIGRFICGLAATVWVAPADASADEVSMKIQETQSVGGVELPFALYVTLSEVTETRLGVDAFVDLRAFQVNAPGLLSQVLDETCKRKLAVAIANASTKGEAISFSGQFQAKFFGCNTKDPKVHYRRSLLFAQNVNFVATATASVDHPCLQGRLVDIQIDPLGFLGSAADLLGLTEAVERLIREKAGEFFAENPVCPELPEELASLSPRFYEGGPREFGDGGLGAALHGSVDVSSGTLLDLIRVMKRRGKLGEENR